MTAQVLDNMDIERERGITIKAQTVRLDYRAQDGQDYVLNLIDTPGHVDFAYEVSRSLAACEGSLLVVDASQGVEAQTLANVYQAIEVNHEIVPVLNKVDLPAADVERVRAQIEDVIGIDASRRRAGVRQDRPGHSRDAGGHRHPPSRPRATRRRRSRPLLVDAWYDAYLGVVVLVRVFDGALKAGQQVRLMNTQATTASRPWACSAPRPPRSTSWARARSATSPPPSRRWPTPRWATPSPTSAAPPPTR